MRPGNKRTRGECRGFFVASQFGRDSLSWIQCSVSAERLASAAAWMSIIVGGMGIRFARPRLPDCPPPGMPTGREIMEIEKCRVAIDHVLERDQGSIGHLNVFQSEKLPSVVVQIVRHMQDRIATKNDAA